MALTPPPPIPQRGDRATFSPRVDAFLKWEGETLVPELNALLANMSAFAAGGVYAIPYLFSSLTPPDPGGRFLRFNNSNPALATNISVSGISNSLQDVGPLVMRFADSTSSIKGSIRVQKLADPSRWAVFDITAVSNTIPGADGQGYFNISCIPIENSGGTPFTDYDGVLLYFQRNGDVGGLSSFPTFYAREEQAAGTGASGSASLGAWMTRVLNTVKVNEISGASLAGNQITLPAGTYEYDGSAMIFGGCVHKAQLYNVSDGSAIDTGTAETGNAANPSATRSLLRGKFTLAAPKVLSVRQYAAGTSAAFYGNTISGAGVPEVYTEIKFKKVA